MEYICTICKLNLSGDEPGPVWTGTGYAHAACAVKPNCPLCNSPKRSLHPAVQHGGEVQPCPNPWHTAD